MSDPCQQQPTIATLQETIRSISGTLREMKKGQERFIEVLEQIASQGVRIGHLEGDINRVEKDTNELFGRIRELEKEPGKEAGAVRTGFWNALIAAAIALVVGLIVRK